MRYVFLKCFFILLAILLFSAAACDSPEKIEDYRLQTSGRIDPPQSDPIHHGLGLLGLEASDLIRPLYQEAGYHMVSRLPVVDQVARSPFHLHGWADATAGKIQQTAQMGLFPLLSAMLSTFNGGLTYELPTGTTAAAADGLWEAYVRLCRQYQVAPDNHAAAKIKQAGFSPAFDRQLGQLLVALTEASHLVRAAVADLTPEEMRYISLRPERYFFPAGSQFNFLTAPTHVPDRVAPITRKIDFVRLYTAGLVLSRGVDRFTNYIRELPPRQRSAHFFVDAKKHPGILLDLPTPLGEMTVLGDDDNVIDSTKALVIDLGGNDLYTGDISVGSRVPGRVALSIDVDGHDVYDRGTRRFGLGFGCLAVGMMVDMSGNDKYRAGNMAQGSGIYGIGVLADLKGRDSYRMGLMGQGFGLFGLGLLLDADGNDRYLLNGMGQGAGSTMGFGGLVDMKGNDQYLAERKKRRGILLADIWSHVQGSGLSIRSPEWKKYPSYYGGIGFLSDGGGDDYYLSSGGNSMGSSYFMSIGALVDHGGDDKYLPSNGYGMGFAVHLSNGILIDYKGNDSYYGKYLTGGAASDRSVAVLVDYAGDDTYGPSEAFVRDLMGIKEETGEKIPEGSGIQEAIYSRLAQNSYAASLKPKALGTLIDYGGNDRYFASPLEGQESIGGVMPPMEPQNWGHAMHFDLGGNDYYYLKGRKNNHYHKFFNHGLSYDSEYHDPPRVGRTPVPADASRTMSAKQLRALLQHSRNIEDLVGLTHRDLFIRYAAAGRIRKKGATAIADVSHLLSVSDDHALNRDLIEILDAFLLKTDKTQISIAQLESLVTAPDPFVRIFAARTIGERRLEDALPALQRATTEKNERVRAHIIRALGQIGSPQAVNALISLAATDPSAGCRRAAIISLGEVAATLNQTATATTTELRDAFLQALADPDETVRTYAAFGLRFYGKEATVIDELNKYTRDNSVYVQRMAAKALIVNGVTEAIPVLIETLRFKSIDTLKLYDREIIKELAFYTGTDFPEEQRYAHAVWSRWWQDFGRTVNLRRNLDIMDTIASAFAAPSEDDGIAIFQRLIRENPDNIVVRNRYLRYCEEWINFRLLTRARITEEILERCLRLQKIITTLEPDSAQQWDRLAYYYARLSRYADAAAAIESALTLEPGNPAYKKVLRRYRQQIKEES